MTQLKLPRPIGPRVLVAELKSGMTLVERGKAAGLEVITSESNEPRITMGQVLAVGNDPFFADEGIKVGVVVFFDSHQGLITTVEGKRFRTLDHTMITNVLEDVPAGAEFFNDQAV